MRLPLLFLFLFLSFKVQSQTLTGVVSDSIHRPLPNANIIAVPYQKEASLKFAIADEKGRYRLELEKELKYEVTVSYIGYKEVSITIEPNSVIKTLHFKLKNTGQQLKEIVIKHEYKPVIIKKDTMTFNVKSFANGNERKMKEILEKLPGVEVDKKGTVTVQGKKVTKMLVEGKSFFGGGSKLAVENIPADALDKIEVIDHFNEVGFMKKVSDSEDLAMNVKLKADKKKFLFGDIEAGTEIANDNGFYLAHAGLFYYSPKTTFCYIGDSNNIGRHTFTFEDLMRFEGGFSSFLSGRKSMNNLMQLTQDNTDIANFHSNFNAINYSWETNKKLSVTGYGLFSKNSFKTSTLTENQYLQNTQLTFEKSSLTKNNLTTLGLLNTKLDYSPNNKTKWFYNIQGQASTSTGKSMLASQTLANNNLFETLQKADNTNLKQFIEGHKSINEKHTATLVVNHSWDKQTPQTVWENNQAFLTSLLPLQNDTTYTLEQIKRTTNHSLDGLLKHYWIINNFNHLYTNIGNNYGTSRLVTQEQQLLTDGSQNNFETAGFGNDIRYQLNDFYVGLEYKFKIGKWVNKPGIYWHQYDLTTEQSIVHRIHKSFLQPQFNSEYEFSQAENLSFTYKLNNTFADVSQYAQNYTLQNYNLVFKGNALLNNEQFHTALLRYSRTNMFRGIMMNAMVNYTQKTKTIRSEIQLEGINQITMPVQTNNPETTWRLNGMFSKKIYRFTFKFSPSLNWFEYLQKINDITNTTQRNSQNLDFSVKTSYRKWPDLTIGYKKSFNQFRGITKTQFETDALNADLEFSFLKSFTFKLEYENFRNENSFFEIAHTSLSYQRKNNPLRFEIFVNNLLNNQAKVSNSFSDYIVSQQQTVILPRTLMLQLSYKL